jgi:hypothetical protein
MTRLWSNNGGLKGFWKRLFHHGNAHNVVLEQTIVATSFDSTSTGTGDTTHSHCLIKGKFSSQGASFEAINETQQLLPVLEISAKNIKESNDDPIGGLVLDSHSDYYVVPEHIKLLQEGGVLFSFTCSSDHHDMLENVVNLSSFSDETTDNCVPYYDKKEKKSYTAVLSRCSYILPGVDIDRLCDPVYLASTSYQKHCQPNGTSVCEQNENTTFRIIKPVIPLLFSLTVQFKVSRIKEDDLIQLSRLVGTRVDCGLLLERTRRNPKRQDATIKAKSVLLYTRIDGGILVNHLTVILQSSLPLIIAMAINKFGAWGLGEACESVVQTRKYTKRTIPT